MKHYQRSKKRQILLSLCCLLGLLLLGGCATEEEPSPPITELSQLEGQKIGVLCSSAFDQYVESIIPAAQKQYYATYEELAAAVKAGEVCAFLMDEPMARVLCAADSALTYLEAYLTEDDYGFAFPKDEDGSRLQAQMNEFLSRLEEDGTLEELRQMWFGAAQGQVTVADWQQLPATNGTLEFVTNEDSAPFAYLESDRLVGYDVDLVIRFCQEYGYGLNIHTVDSATFVDGISSGQYDLGACGFSITEERSASMYFSQPNYSGGVVAVIAACGDGCSF